MSEELVSHLEAELSKGGYEVISVERRVDAAEIDFSRRNSVRLRLTLSEHSGANITATCRIYEEAGRPWTLLVSSAKSPVPPGASVAAVASALEAEALRWAERLAEIYGPLLDALSSGELGAWTVWGVELYARRLTGRWTSAARVYATCGLVSSAVFEYAGPPEAGEGRLPSCEPGRCVGMKARSLDEFIATLRSPPSVEAALTRELLDVIRGSSLRCELVPIETRIDPGKLRFTRLGGGGYVTVKSLLVDLDLGVFEVSAEGSAVLEIRSAADVFSIVPLVSEIIYRGSKRPRAAGGRSGRGVKRRFLAPGA